MFYISSFGGTATMWLALALSKHPSVVCFHGLRTFPPNLGKFGSVGSIDPDDFISALLDMEISCVQSNMFGAVHGFSGTKMKEPTESRGGKFTAIVGHPINRIASLFAANMRTIDQDAPANINAFEQASERHGSELGLSATQGNVQLGKIGRLFLEICDGTIRYDMECVKALDPEFLLKFETITTDRRYFADKFRVITAGNSNTPNASLEVTDAYLDEVFSLNVQNRRVGALSPQEIVAKWPPAFRYLFALIVRTHGGREVFDFYDSLGYEIPDQLQKINLATLDTIPDSM